MSPPSSPPRVAASLPLTPPNKKPRINNTSNNTSNNTPISLVQLKKEDQYYRQRCEEYFQALVQFKSKHGHVHIHSNDDTSEFDPSTGNDEDWDRIFEGKIPPPSLFRFSETLRRQLESTNIPNTNNHHSSFQLLTPERILQLDCLGFPWKCEHDNRGETGWKQRYQELCQFHRQHGHCNVPSNHRRQPANTIALYEWCRKQRDHCENLQTKFKMQAECERAAEQNNGVIPADLLSKYSAACSKVLLTPEHFLDLYRLGFVFDKPKRGKDKWEEQYQKLVQFHKQNGHTRVSVYTHQKDNNSSNKDDSLYSLAIWVKSQRRQHRLIRRRQEEGKSPGTLQFLKQFEARTKKLNALGFEWDASAHAVHSPAYQNTKKKQTSSSKNASLKHDESSDNDDQDSESDNDYTNNNHHNGRNAGHGQFHRFYTNYYS